MRHITPRAKTCLLIVLVCRRPGRFASFSVNLATGFPLCDVPHMLRQTIGDLEPGRLRPHENVSGGPDRGIVSQCAHGDVDEGAVADHRIEQRTAAGAVRVMRAIIAEYHQLIAASRHAEFGRATPANGLNADPVVRRQLGQ